MNTNDLWVPDCWCVCVAISTLSTRMLLVCVGSSVLPNGVLPNGILHIHEGVFRNWIRLASLFYSNCVP